MFFFQLDQVRKHFDNSTPKYQLPQCKDVKEKVVECYKANSKQTLNCSGIVADFESCVQSHRSKLLNDKYGVAKPIAAAAS